MNKALLLLATAAFGTAAIAQTTMPDASATPPTTSPDMSTSAPSQTPAPTDTTATPAPAPMPADSATPAPMPADTATPAPMAGDSASTPATTPPASGAMPMATASTTDYPTCSRTVTDKCVQRGAMAKPRKRR